MAVMQPLGSEIDFVRNAISRPVTCFFVIIFLFILTAIFEIKVHVKKIVIFLHLIYRESKLWNFAAYFVISAIQNRTN